ncbi:MAG: type II toxin-antitoxin system prevent-host-death family antitoxin [Candidatus Daviesbacteria bacterium]|nr:type II toxin-antitoxin system prevent-host-death family antitoxin [Candidatus Daviesbacteria bacterium]
MNTLRVSATKARNNFFSLLDQVALGQQVIIEKDSKEVAILSPKKQTVDWVALKKASEAVHGIWKDYDPEDNPLRRRNAWPSLGKWDKSLKFKK